MKKGFYGLVKRISIYHRHVTCGRRLLPAEILAEDLPEVGDTPSISISLQRRIQYTFIHQLQHT